MVASFTGGGYFFIWVPGAIAALRVHGIIGMPICHPQKYAPFPLGMVRIFAFSVWHGRVFFVIIYLDRGMAQAQKRACRRFWGFPWGERRRGGTHGGGGVDNSLIGMYIGGGSRRDLRFGRCIRAVCIGGLRCSLFIFRLTDERCYDIQRSFLVSGTAWTT